MTPRESMGLIAALVVLGATAARAQAPGPIPSLPVPRYGLGAAVLDGRLYVVGGYSNERGVLDRLDIYDPKVGTWREGPSMAERRTLHAVAVVGSAVYAIGGSGSQGIHHLRSVERYSPAEDRWEPVASLPVGLTRFSAAALDGKLHVVGGFGDGVDRADVLVHDPATDAWSRGPPLPVANHGHDAIVLGGRLHVLGGLGDMHLHLVLEGGRWRRLAPLPTGRIFFRAAVVGGRLYVIAGGSNDAEDWTAVQAYDPASDEWSQGPPCPSRRYHHAVAVLEGEVLALGGVAVGGESGPAVVDRFDPAAGRWR